MSVEFYTCKHCGETFSECGDFVECESCGTKWCDDECAEADGYIREYCSLHPDLDSYDSMHDYRIEHCDCGSCADCGYFVLDSCKYCREEDFDDYVLLEYALQLLGVNREELIIKYRDTNKEKK